METIESAPVGSIIGICGLGTGRQQLHSNRAYLISDRYPGEVTVLPDETTVLQIKVKGEVLLVPGTRQNVQTCLVFHGVNISSISVKCLRRRPESWQTTSRININFINSQDLINPAYATYWHFGTPLIGTLDHQHKKSGKPSNRKDDRCVPPEFKKLLIVLPMTWRTVKLWSRILNQQHLELQMKRSMKQT